MTSIIKRYGTCLLNLTKFEMILVKNNKLIFHGSSLKNRLEPLTFSFDTDGEAEKEFDNIQKALDEHYSS